MCKLANNETGIVLHGPTVLDLMKTTLNFDISFKEEYNKKFVATGIVEITKEVIGSDFSLELRSQS